MQKFANNRSFGLALILAALLFGFASGPAAAGAVMEKAPADPDPAKKYFFYMHGGYVEKRGSDSTYDYHSILGALADKGFEIIGEARGLSHPGRYAKGIAEQVNGLLDKGVPAANIIVGGHSKGGFMTLLTSTMVGRDDIKYTVLAACGKKGTPYFKNYRRFINRNAEKLTGKFLVMWDENDQDAGNCDKAFDKSDTNPTNLILETGKGHQLFYQHEESWLTPVVAFINEN